MDLVSELEAIFNRVSRAIFSNLGLECREVQPDGGRQHLPIVARQPANVFFYFFCPSLTYIVMAYTVMALLLIIYTVMAYIRARKYSPVGIWHSLHAGFGSLPHAPKH